MQYLPDSDLCYDSYWHLKNLYFDFEQWDVWWRFLIAGVQTELDNQLKFLRVDGKYLR